MKKAASIIALLIILLFITASFMVPEAGKKRTSDRGIYVTAYVAQLPVRFEYLKKHAKKAGLNTLVIDAKEVLSRPFIDLIRQKKLLPGTRPIANPWLSKLAEDLHREGFIVTVRLVVFKDDRLVLARPDLGVRLRGGGLYRDRKSGKWADPYSDEVRLYNALIAESAALSGVDEVQFDYIRFPAEGMAQYASYPHVKEGISKVDIICEFLKETRARVAPYNTSLAVDIFGVTAWQSKNDIENLGQDLKRMAKYLDVISPMLYPSHFHAGYDGYDNPGSYPYHFINTGVEKAKGLLSDEATVLVPWIQGFNLRSPNFGPGYITEQVRGAEKEGVRRFLIWNASNNYDVSFRALGKD
jgi:hypothetical protein